VTIYDDDHQISFAINNVSVNEGGAFVHFGREGYKRPIADYCVKVKASFELR